MKANQLKGHYTGTKNTCTSRVTISLSAHIPVAFFSIVCSSIPTISSSVISCCCFGGIIPLARSTSFHSVSSFGSCGNRNHIFTVCERSLGQGNAFTRTCLFTGGGLPPRGSVYKGALPTGGVTPPPTNQKNGRYSSYWNAFLLL